MHSVVCACVVICTRVRVVYGVEHCTAVRKPTRGANTRRPPLSGAVSYGTSLERLQMYSMVACALPVFIKHDSLLHLVHPEAKLMSSEDVPVYVYICKQIFV
jgi:hypothetical protein